MCSSDKERTAHVIIVSAELVFGGCSGQARNLGGVRAEGLKL